MSRRLFVVCRPGCHMVICADCLVVVHDRNVSHYTHTHTPFCIEQVSQLHSFWFRNKWFLNRTNLNRFAIPVPAYPIMPTRNWIETKITKNSLLKLSRSASDSIEMHVDHGIECLFCLFSSIWRDLLHIVHILWKLHWRMKTQHISIAWAVHSVLPCTWIFRNWKWFTIDMKCTYILWLLWLWWLWWLCVCVFEHDHKIERRKPFGATMLCGSMCWAVDQTRVRNVLTS